MGFDAVYVKMCRSETDQEVLYVSCQPAIRLQIGDKTGSAQFLRFFALDPPLPFLILHQRD
jgi:hypothetical protein